MAIRPTTSTAPTREGFAKTRSDHASETFEDYAEAVEDICAKRGTCRVRDLAVFMRVSHVTVVKIVGRMVASGIARKARHGPVELTPSGARIAQAARARHAIVVAFLRSIGVPKSHAQRDAEGMEHHVGAQTLRAMKRRLSSATSRTRQ